MIAPTRFSFLAFCFSLLLAGNASFAQNKFITDSLDSYINREMQRWRVPGLAIVVVKDGKVVAMKGYGVRDITTNEKVDENTLFQIASNTKAFAGTCVAMLHYQKKLSLDDKVTKWLPDFRLHDTLATLETTVRDQLCHRVGFKTFQGDFLHWNNKLSTKQLVKNMRTLKPAYSFRSRWGYYNMGFAVSGEIIEAASDTTWQDYMTWRILKPLEMNRTSPHFSFLQKDNNKATGYTLLHQPGAKEDVMTKVPYANVDNIGAAASLNSCVKDMANWMIANMDSGKLSGRRALPYEAVREAQRSQSLVSDINNPDNPTAHFLTYGLGWFLQDFNGRKIVRHGGGTNGFVTQTVLVPEEKLGIVVLTNTDANDLYSVLPYQIIESYLNMPYRNLSARAFQRNAPHLQSDRKHLDSLYNLASKIVAPEKSLGSYTGTYTNPFYGNMTITITKETLTASFPNHNVTGTLKPIGGNNFLVEYSDKTWGVQQMPFKLENNKVKSVSVKVNDFIDYDSYEFVRK
ncbi:MAG TPA: serine hydrolase [Chitinophagales bacterium]|nr:serine hydrolase [Chitinophagales bacterium]